MSKLFLLKQYMAEQNWEAIKELDIVFVRSEKQLGVYDGIATGKQLSAHEVAKRFPYVVDEIIDKGVAVIRKQDR